MKTAYEIMKKADTIAIFTHITPDCDGVDSSIALKLHLESIGKKVQLFCEDKISEYLKFLPKVDTYKTEIYSNFDLYIVLDCVNLNRIGKLAEIVSKQNNILAIDHHPNFDNFAHYSISNPNASSTGEMLFEFFNTNKIEITKEIAKSLYASIASDTGGFIQSNSNVKVFNYIANLMQLNIDYNYINEKLFFSKSLNQVMLYKTALNNSKFYYDNSVLICILTEKDFKQNNSTREDAHGIIGDLRCISTVKLCILLSEKEKNCFSVSIRSKDNISSNALASLYGGGGHFYASGCLIRGKIKHIIPKLLENIEKVLKNE